MTKREKWLNRMAKLEWQLNRELPRNDHLKFSVFVAEVLKQAEEDDENQPQRRARSPRPLPCPFDV